MPRRLLLFASLLLASCEPVVFAPQGIALIRFSELPGPCAFEKDEWALPEIPEDLPFVRARAVASFQESVRWPGGHAITLGWTGEDGEIGRMQVEVPPSRGYGIAFFPNAQFEQAVGYETWKDGVRTFAPTAVEGVLNYQPQQEPPPGFLGRRGEWNGPERPPERLYLHVGFTGVNPDGDTICRIVGMHSVTYRDRQESYDPSWLVVDGTFHFVNANGVVTPPSYSNTVAPSAALVLPLDAPPDPGEPAPWIEVKAPLALQRSSGDGSSACD